MGRVDQHVGRVDQLLQLGLLGNIAIAMGWGELTNPWGELTNDWGELVWGELVLGRVDLHPSVDSKRTQSCRSSFILRKKLARSL